MAKKLQNPRLLRISFHTFRHWKATTIQHQTHDPWIVKEVGHTNLRSTEICITYEKTIYESNNDEYTVKVVKDPNEIRR